MAVTDAQYQALITAELQATGADLTALSGQMAVIWENYADKGRVSGRLRYLYARRHAVDLLMGQHWQDVDHNETDVSDSASQLIEHLESLRKLTDDAIDLEIREVRGTRAPKSGRLAATAPVTVTSPPDPNGRGYRGDPLQRS